MKLEMIHTPTLFVDLPEPAAAQPAPAGPFAAVALEQGIDRALDYAIPPSLLAQLRPGQRVRVPLGKRNRPTYGYVIDIHSTTDYPRIKRLLGIDDARVLVSPRMMDLTRWMSRYYCAPLGSAIEAVLPSAVRRKVGIGYAQMVRLAKDPPVVQEILEKTRAAKRRAILARLLQIEAGGSIELFRLAGEAGVKPPTIRKLAKLGLITITPEIDLPRLTREIVPTAGDEAEIALNEDQRRVFDALVPRVRDGGFSVNLLLGVTGSGKTEIYLQCIREAVSRGRTAIVLVPEIALTPQTVRRFTARFQNVAILHSGLTATERHRYWQQISTGHAQVVVGARSAIFAPLPNLGMIVVDEEHESSYKQDTAPRYHARDVAIKRAQLESIPILLGSATPSLESYYRTIKGRREEEEGRRDEGTKGQREKETEGRRDEGTKGQRDGETEGPRDERRKGQSGEASGDKPVKQTPIRGEAVEQSTFSHSSFGFDSGFGFRNSDSPSADSGFGVRPAGFPPPAPSSLSPFVPKSLPPIHSLLHLPTRVRGLKMPHVELIDMKMEGKFRRGIHLLSQRLEHLLRATIEAGQQAILLLNRRGYSNFVYCSSCQNAIQCKYCDATMTYHRSANSDARDATLAQGVHTGQLHCHYCLAVNPLPSKCPDCGKLLSLFGLGTQRVEEELAHKFPDLKYARVDSDSMRGAKDYENLLGRFARGELQAMLGTQMIAKGLDYPNVTLVGVISGDTALALPDFRAAERTFQLITQVAGRAGRGDSAGRVVLQTFLPEDPTIQAAIKQDYVGFARTELVHRREVGLPPFARMARVVLRDEDQQKLHKRSEELAAAFSTAIAAAGNQVKMKGPMPCAISRIAGYHRDQIVLSAAGAPPLQRVLAAVRKSGALAKNERIAVDVDPVSLL